MRRFSRVDQRMNKLILLLIIWLALLTLSFNNPSMATGSSSQLDELNTEDGPTIVVGNADDSAIAVVTGSTFTMPVHIQDIPDGMEVGTFTVDIMYDNTFLKPLSCPEESSGEGIIELCNVAFPPSIDTIRIIGTYAQGLFEDRELPAITFETIGAGGSSTALTVSVEKMTDGNANPIKHTAQGQDIEIIKLGDVDCDGDLDLFDALDELKFLVELLEGSSQCPPPPGTLYLPACDNNADGSCDIFDVVNTLKCLVEIPVDSLCPADGFIFNNPANDLANDPANDPANDNEQDESQIDEGLAETDGTLHIELPAVTAGSTFSATVMLDTETEFAVGQVQMGYDSTQFKVVDCQVAQNVGVCNPNYQEGNLLFNVALPSGASGSLPLAHVTFEHIGDRVETSTFRLAAPTFANSQEESIVVTVENQTVGEHWLYLPMIER